MYKPRLIFDKCSRRNSITTYWTKHSYKYIQIEHKKPEFYYFNYRQFLVYISPIFDTFTINNNNQKSQNYFGNYLYIYLTALLTLKSSGKMKKCLLC